MAAYLSVLKAGDTILGMDLAQGGHLTHGSKVNFSGILFRAYSYGVDRQTETIDYDAVQKLAEECRPRMIVVGASAYARVLIFPAFNRSPNQSEPTYWSIWPTSRASLPPAFIPIPCLTPTSSRPLRTKLFADRRRRHHVQGGACQGR